MATVYPEIAGVSGGEVTLKASTNIASTNSTTAYNVVYTFTLPGGVMGPNDSITIESLWGKTGSTNTANTLIRFGGSDILNKSGYGATNKAIKHHAVVANQGSTSSQSAYGDTKDTSYGITTTALEAMSIDTSADVDIEFIAWVTDAADSVELRSLIIKLVQEV